MLLFTKKLILPRYSTFWRVPNTNDALICDSGLRVLFPELHDFTGRKIWIEAHSLPRKHYRVRVRPRERYDGMAAINLDGRRMVVTFACMDLLHTVCQLNKQKCVYVQIMYQPTVKRAPRSRK